MMQAAGADTEMRHHTGFVMTSARTSCPLTWLGPPCLTPIDFLLFAASDTPLWTLRVATGHSTRSDRVFHCSDAPLGALPRLLCLIVPYQDLHKD